MKRPQTKFHSDTMSNVQVIRSKKVNLSSGQNLSLGQTFLAAQFFLRSIFYWNYNNRYWCAFACL